MFRLEYGLLWNTVERSLRKNMHNTVPWGLFKYTCLPQGIFITTDIFQSRLSGLLSHLLYVIVYIDDIAIITNGYFEDHLTKVKEVQQFFLNSGLQVNPLNCT